MKRFTLALLLAPLFSTAAMATGYTGPGAATQVTTVAAALDAADDTAVLQGQIVKRLQDELYEFKDASGTINVEIDDEHWPAQAISETAVVKISGEVDRDLTSREIDVEYLELVK
jgi:uncharacterized protein (TIGR00156 family)